LNRVLYYKDITLAAAAAAAAAATAHDDVLNITR